MARPKPDLPSAAGVRAAIDDQGRLTVRVTPGARSESLEIADGRLLARVRAKPEDGQANAAVLDLLGKALGVPTSRLRLLRGATSREKLFELR
jgi:uncharacterized protein YggU (UPF0235/DUF167 family)